MPGILRQTESAGLWEELRSRFILRAYDAILTARPPHAVGFAYARRRSNYRRVHTLVRLADMALPASITWIKGRLLRPQRVPFADWAIEVLSFGAGSTVYLLTRRPTNPHGADLVLKVNRKSLGRPSETLVQSARVLRETYRQVCAWYADSAVVVPTDFVILQGPLLGRPAVACLQPYVDGEKQDFFALARTGAVAALLREHPPLRAQFRCFVERTLHVLESEERCVDLIGRDNLLVVWRGGGVSLQLIDHGVLDLRTRRVREDGRAAAVLGRVACLRRIYDAIGRAD